MQPNQRAGSGLLSPIPWIVAIGTALGSGAALADAPLKADSPTVVVERLHTKLIGVMKSADKLGYDGRAETLAPVLGDAYDLPFMARRSVGSRNWKALSEAEQARFLETFKRFTVANYAGRFDDYDGEHFETLAEEPSVQQTVLVRTRIVRSRGGPIRLDYRLHRANGRWLIVDVYLNGTISEMAMRRSEYSGLLRREGLPALLEALEDKIADLKEG